MKDFDLKKECEIENFDYSSCWDEEEEKEAKGTISEFSRGSPRKGINGKYLKKKNHIGRMQLRQSWSKGKIKDEL